MKRFVTLVLVLIFAAYQKQAVLITENYIFNVTATSVGKDRIDYMLSMFLKSDGN